MIDDFCGIGNRSAHSSCHTLGNIRRMVDLQAGIAQTGLCLLRQRNAGLYIAVLIHQQVQRSENGNIVDQITVYLIITAVDLAVEVVIFH